MRVITVNWFWLHLDKFSQKFLQDMIFTEIFTEICTQIWNSVMQFKGGYTFVIWYICELERQSLRRIYICDLIHLWVSKTNFGVWEVKYESVRTYYWIRGYKEYIVTINKKIQLGDRYILRDNWVVRTFWVHTDFDTVRKIVRKGYIFFVVWHMFISVIQCERGDIFRW